VVTVHLGTSLPHVHQVPKCPKVVHLGLDHVTTPFEYHWNIKALLSRLPNGVVGAERCVEGVRQEEHHSRGIFR
jgi:hypothetical protein